MERTSFGMQKSSNSLQAGNNFSNGESKPALPKRSPAPKQDTDSYPGAKDQENTKTLAENALVKQLTTEIDSSVSRTTTGKILIGYYKTINVFGYKFDITILLINFYLVYCS